MKIKLLLSLLFTLCASSLWAYDVEVGGIYYNLIKKVTAAEVTKSNYAGNIIIPAEITVDGVSYSVRTISESAFRNCKNLTGVTIPNSVTNIGDYAFVGCSSLTSITIPNSVTSIGKLAFWECSNLTSIKVDEGNSYYDSREECNAIIETKTNTLILGCMNTIIPNSVTSIGDFAFRECSNLTSIEIPNSVTSIGDYAFDFCI